MRFFKWLLDRIIHHTYFYKQPAEWMKVEKWYPPVHKKKCRVCGVVVWTNNPVPICGKLRCWLKGV